MMKDWWGQWECLEYEESEEYGVRSVGDGHGSRGGRGGRHLIFRQSGYDI